MHELSIAEGIIEIVERTANANHVRHVKTVRVSIGELAGVDIPSLEFAWQSVRKGGVAQNAELEIERPNGEAWCLQCQKNIPLHRCGGYQLAATGGTEMRVIDILEAADDPADSHG